MSEAALCYPIAKSATKFAGFENALKESGRNFNVDVDRKNHQDSVFLDKRGKWRTFDPKKLSRKRGGSLRGRGWKYGSGFVDGVIPVLSPMADQILRFVQQETDAAKIWRWFNRLPPTHNLWDDLINVAVQLRISKQWDPVIAVCEWILYKSPFRPDVICYNLLIDAFGQKRQLDKAEAVYSRLLEARCVPTDDTYALLLRACCRSGSLHKAEAVFTEMRKNGIPPSVVVYNAYLDGLLKGRCTQEAIEIFQRMKKDRCTPSTETYTLMINIYGKMRTEKCKANICTYTALINAFAREGLCEKAEEVFEQLQEAGHEPDVYAYNALMEAYSTWDASPIALRTTYWSTRLVEPAFTKVRELEMLGFILKPHFRRLRARTITLTLIDAQATFEELKRRGMTPTMKSHMLLLSAYSKAGNIPKCEEIMNQMHESGLEPDTFALNSMLDAYGKAGLFDKMEQVLSKLETGPYATDVSSYNILINVYGRAGFFDQMEELFRCIPRRGLKADVITWTSRISAYSRKKQYEKCLDLFEEMIDSGCYPDGGTAKVLLAACSSEEQVEQVTAIRERERDATTFRVRVTGKV
ncbi:Pentatricopeptide repeat-containing protein, partial [Ananas comosus]